HMQLHLRFVSVLKR
uniref:Uncharacterized protein n=1 Tax=Amphimedon queenslandica TaxID=400682 RepID=A0A1X7TC24_AMPQE